MLAGRNVNGNLLSGPDCKHLDVVHEHVMATPGTRKTSVAQKEYGCIGWACGRPDIRWLIDAVERDDRCGLPGYRCCRTGGHQKHCGNHWQCKELHAPPFLTLSRPRIRG